jgi:hypothetical protein
VNRQHEWMRIKNNDEHASKPAQERRTPAVPNPRDGNRVLAKAAYRHCLEVAKTPCEVRRYGAASTGYDMRSSDQKPYKTNNGSYRPYVKSKERT